VKNIIKIIVVASFLVAGIAYGQEYKSWGEWADPQQHPAYRGYDSCHSADCGPSWTDLRAQRPEAVTRVPTRIPPTIREPYWPYKMIWNR
jgi:hypothetical protein